MSRLLDVLLDEPMRALDIGAAADLRDRIVSLVAAGEVGAVLYATQSLLLDGVSMAQVRSPVLALAASRVPDRSVPRRGLPPRHSCHGAPR